MFNAGVTSDLKQLKSRIAHHIDSLMRHNFSSPSHFNVKISAGIVTRDEVNVALHSKIKSRSELINQNDIVHFMEVGDFAIETINEIVEIIKRLYFFNAFITTDTMTLIRKIEKDITVYLPYLKSKPRITFLHPVNPTLSFMTDNVMALQEDIRALNEFFLAASELDFASLMQKVIILSNLGRHKDCLKLCDTGISNFPFKSETFRTKKITCLMHLKRNDEAYKELTEFLKITKDIVSHRSAMYPLLTDNIALGILRDTLGIEEVQRMKSCYEREEVQLSQFLAKYTQFKQKFSEQSV